MADLSVTSVTIEELLRKLKSREWLIPQFQREFVWSVGDVIELVHSIIGSRPIGMATIWEQADDKNIELGPLSLPDRSKPDNLEVRRKFCNSEDNPSKVFAVLDGLQRCTAVALAFGGFHTVHGDYRTSGRYFLSVGAPDPLDQIIFLKDNEVVAQHLDNDAACISRGYFPLSSNQPEESFMGQWLRYIQTIRDSQFYPKGEMPAGEELERRNEVLKRAFEGINRTKLAVYVVPDTYSLADICDIFEKLNTTGTKVSTVDLIHSWLYADTLRSAASTIRLREWIDDFGQKEGAIGWADVADRPELVVQMVTACHVALEEKTPPRKVGRAQVAPIVSVKAGDLLATPTEHWRLMIDNDNLLARFLGDFQKTVVQGLFPWKWCPYPATAAIYVALRSHEYFDAQGSHKWGIDDLAAIFRAFFWRTALTRRYDQGFLTQLGVDIKELKRLLNQRSLHATAGKWAAATEPELQKLVQFKLPSKEELVGILTDGRPGGAMQKALYLSMLATADRDFLDDTISLRYPQQDLTVQLHHIYPRDWCRSNKSAILAQFGGTPAAERDWVNAVCNLAPLSRQSNNVWKAKNPGTVIIDRGIVYQPLVPILSRVYIDQICFDALTRGADGIRLFWEYRAELMANDLLSRAALTI